MINDLLKYFLAVSFILLLFSCRKESGHLNSNNEVELCHSPIDTGLIEPSLNLIQLIPQHYWNIEDTLKFRNNNNEIYNFVSGETFDLIVGPEAFETICKNDSSQVIRYIYDHKRIDFNYQELNDSLIIKLILNIKPITNGFVHTLNIRLLKSNNESPIATVEHRASIQFSDFDLSIVPESYPFLFYENYDKLETFDLLNETFSDVYTSIGNGSRIYYKPNLGIIGFTDRMNQDWVIEK